MGGGLRAREHLIILFVIVDSQNFRVGWVFSHHQINPLILQMLELGLSKVKHSSQGQTSWYLTFNLRVYHDVTQPMPPEYPFLLSSF